MKPSLDSIIHSIRVLERFHKEEYDMLYVFVTNPKDI